MAARRRYGQDYAFSEWHRHYLESRFPRTGHRCHAIDLDLVEFCPLCKTPLMLIEEMQYMSERSFDDKGTTVTRKLGKMAGLDAFLIGTEIERSDEAQDELTRIGQRAIEICTDETVIKGFWVRQINPTFSKMRVSAEELCDFIVGQHKAHLIEHHPGSRDAEYVNEIEMHRLMMQHRMVTGRQEGLFLPEAVAS